MYFYEIGYSDWESCPTYTLYHDKLFTQAQFDNMMCECFYEANKIEEAKHNKWISSDKDITEENRNFYAYKPRVDNLFNTAYDILIKKYEFTDLKFDAKFIPTATEPILPDEERSEYVGDIELKKIRDYFERIGMRDDKINDIIQNEKPST